MSYDLQVFAPSRLTSGELRALLASIKFETDDGEHTDSITVVRGAKRQYSFTLGLPVAVEAEDVPEVITAVVLGPDYVYELLVEGSSPVEAEHAVRFGRRLAEATQGALLDQQTGQIWTRGNSRTPPPVVAGTVSVLQMVWYVRAEFDAAATAADWTRLAGKHLPEALPRRYGTYEPLSKRLDDGGVAAFVEFVGNADGTVFYKGSRPVQEGHLAAGPRRGNATGHKLTLLLPGIADPRWWSALRSLFVNFSVATEAIAATAEVIRGVRWSGRTIGYDANTERAAYLAWKSTWQGLSPYPVWWSWFGGEYADAIADYLPRDQVETVGAGLFHWRSEAPADRDVLAASLVPSTGRSRRLFKRSAGSEAPWLPGQFLATMADQAIGSHAVPQRAAWLPPMLA